MIQIILISFCSCIGYLITGTTNGTIYGTTTALGIILLATISEIGKRKKLDD